MMLIWRWWPGGVVITPGWVVTVRFLGTFLADPLDVPVEVLDFVAAQVDVADPSAVKRYLERRTTRFEHQAEIAAVYGYRDFADAELDLARSVDHQAWLTGDGPKALFDAAVLWLRERKVLLPGVSTLARLVARVRDAALQRMWNTLAGLLTAGQARLLEELLDVPDGARVSDLERLRRGPTQVSGKAMVGALERLAEIAGLGLGSIDVGGVPPRRVAELARYGMTGKAPALRRHPYSRKLATLLATVVALEAKATDDALELFDVLMTNQLMGRAERESSKDKLRRFPRLSRDAAKCAAAVAVPAQYQAGEQFGEGDLGGGFVVEQPHCLGDGAGRVADQPARGDQIDGSVCLIRELTVVVHQAHGHGRPTEQVVYG